ncbi:hypothetical protein UFOVP760_62 [uncultured Caudovirales phage]|uniref:Uncharacterized protein n=1 Tax=uncultured Caudovirales phage TaxID=2100421 RepID=A0A6J7XBL1_9CAUD|nr:hypothetical protein UFOVP760_62 [uncultured Caudovirales phage]
MRWEQDADKVVLSKEDFIWYQQRRKECKVYDPAFIPQRTFINKKKKIFKRY